MKHSLEAQERHLLVKVIDRVLYKLEDVEDAVGHVLLRLSIRDSPAVEFRDNVRTFFFEQAHEVLEGALPHT